MQRELNLVQDQNLISMLEHEQFAKEITHLQTKNGRKHNVKFVNVGTMQYYGIMTVFDCLGENGEIYGSIAISPKNLIAGPVVSALSPKKQMWNRHSLARARLMNIIDTLINEQQKN